MVLLDSNIVIYSSQAAPEYDLLRQYLLDNPHCVSMITYVEVLGFHKISEEDKTTLEIFFESAPVLSVSKQIADQAVKLRQIRNMKLGDALIAATAIAHDLVLVTRNTKDFKWITSLNLFDPSQAVLPVE